MPTAAGSFLGEARCAITQAAHRQGIGVVLVAALAGTGDDERRRKRNGHHDRLCVLCTDSNQRERVAMSMLPGDAGDDALVASLLAGCVVVCAGCGDAQGELECEGCGERLCAECWAGGDAAFCEGCLCEEPELRPMEDVPVKEAYL